MEEIWKEIKEYNGEYLISNLGRVKSKKYKTDKILKPLETGYYNHIYLYKNGKGKNHNIHRLVAEAFIPNPNKYPCINHINENPKDNMVSNLEWCTQKYNINYGTRTQKVIDKMRIEILQYDLKGNFVKEWNSIQDAIRKYHNYHISSVLKGKRNTASGYIWKYKMENK